MSSSGDSTDLTYPTAELAAITLALPTQSKNPKKGPGFIPYRLTSFHLFPLLPPEIQIHIFRHAFLTAWLFGHNIPMLMRSRMIGEGVPEEELEEAMEVTGGWKWIRCPMWWRAREWKWEIKCYEKRETGEVTEREEEAGDWLVPRVVFVGGLVVEGIVGFMPRDDDEDSDEEAEESVVVWGRGVGSVMRRRWRCSIRSIMRRGRGRSGRG